MNSEKNILIAFILNLMFSVFEFFGGIYTGSVAIVSDSIHDVGDAMSIGMSFVLEKKSKTQPDDKYTYGYARYSVLGSAINTLILVVGSVLVIVNAINKIISPIEINYDGMILFAVVGVIVNLSAAFFTRNGESLNQKAVNLHMVEDVLGWIVVLIGAVVIKFTGVVLIDPIMSICVAVFILTNSIKNLKEILDVLLEKIPDNLDINEIKKHILDINNVLDVHHIHIWSIDGRNNYATMHIVTIGNAYEIKRRIREKMREHKIFHTTIEIESKDECCFEKNCKVEVLNKTGHNHCHHHH